MRKVRVNNLGRDQGRRMYAIKKKVNESWSKTQNPNLFGGGPVVDNSGKIISVEISAFGFVAEFFKDNIKNKIKCNTKTTSIQWVVTSS